MATSGVKSFALTRNDIINAALRKIGEFDSAETPSGDDTAHASQALNVLVNEYAGIHGADIFLRAEVTLFLQKGQTSYVIGSTDHATETYVESALTAAASDETLTLDSTGMTAGDYIGIKLSSGATQWTTIDTVDSATQVTVDDAVTASSGALVYSYTSKAFRPSGIFAPFRRSPEGYDTEVRSIGDAEYRQLTIKAQTGIPNSIFYRPSVTTGTMYVWPTGDGTTDKINFIAHYNPDDFVSASDTAQFPVEWSSALIWGLAAELAPEYGLPDREQVRIYKIASMKLDHALSADIEGSSVIFARAQ